MPSGPGERYDFFLSRRGSVASVAQEITEVLTEKGYKVLVQDYDMALFSIMPNSWARGPILGLQYLDQCTTGSSGLRASICPSSLSSISCLIACSQPSARLARLSRFSISLSSCWIRSSEARSCIES
jgi:hypothetical protein